MAASMIFNYCSKLHGEAYFTGATSAASSLTFFFSLFIAMNMLFGCCFAIYLSGTFHFYLEMNFWISIAFLNPSYFWTWFWVGRWLNFFARPDGILLPARVVIAHVLVYVPYAPSLILSYFLFYLYFISLLCLVPFRHFAWSYSGLFRVMKQKINIFCVDFFWFSLLFILGLR